MMPTNICASLYQLVKGHSDICGVIQGFFFFNVCLILFTFKKIHILRIGCASFVKRKLAFIRFYSALDTASYGQVLH